MQLKPFRIERYYAQHEFSTRYMLSSSDCQSRTIAELLAFEPDAERRLHETWCGYTESSGSAELREAIAALYERAGADDVIVCSCAEEGIFLLYHALLAAGDHAIVETPCYESALELARSTGAAVSEWRRTFAGAWAHDLDALRAALSPATRVLYVNQPHNPTGTLMERATFEAVAELAACDLLPAGVSLGSISKSYGLPGLRLGWLVTRDRGLRQRLLALKDYTTICSSAPSEVLTALGLRHRERLLQRNLELVARNLALVERFFGRHADSFQWVRPTASPIGFPRVTGLGDVDALCVRLAGAGVLLLPGSVYDVPDHVRVGFGRGNLPEALDLLETALTAA